MKHFLLILLALFIPVCVCFLSSAVALAVNDNKYWIFSSIMTSVLLFCIFEMINQLRNIK